VPLQQVSWQEDLEQLGAWQKDLKQLAAQPDVQGQL
jgi:hypothetical protein